MAADDNQALLLQVSADISKLEKAFAKASGTVDQHSSFMERRAKQLGQNVEGSVAKIDFGKALDKVFDSSRLAVLEEGGAKLRIFGSALEPLGALGIAAAAGLAAFGIGLEEAHKALEFADSLYKLAKNAHVTTDELQAFQYALRLAGGDGARASEGLQAFSEKLGGATVGLPRALRAFRELFGQAFTATDAKNLGDAGEALVTITAAIEKLKSPSQKDVVVQQLGLDSMKPLIEGGVEKMREFLAEAEKAGVIMDSGIVKKGHELNEQLETLNTKISVSLKTAFVELGPVLVYLVGKMADLAHFAEVAAGGLTSIDKRSTTTLQAERDNLVKRDQDPVHRLLRPDDPKQIAAIDAELAARAKRGPDKAPLPTGDASLADLSKHKAGPKDDTAGRTDQVAEALATAEKGRLAAELALTQNLEDRARFERAEIDAELAVSTAKLEKQREGINADKALTDAKRKDLNAAIDAAEFTVQATAEAKKVAIDLAEQRKTEDSALADNRTMAGYLDAALVAHGAIADTLKERRRIALAILDADQRLERIAQKEALDRAVEDKSMRPDAAALQLAAGDEARAAKRQAAVKTNQGPIDTYLDSLKDLDTEFQTAGVQAAKDLSAALVQAGGDMHKFGGAVLSVLRNLLTQAATAALQKEVFGPLLKAGAAVFGFADGTDFAPGGPAIVGERGPELVNLPRGSQVIPNHGLSALANVGAAQARAQVIVYQPFTLSFDGAVVTEDLIAQANRNAAALASRATMAGANLGKSMALNEIKAMSRNRLGR